MMLAGLLLSCGAPEETCRIDRGFSEAKAGAIRTAGKAWEAIAFKRISFVDDDDADWLIISAEVPDNWRGHTSKTRHLVRVDPSTPDTDVFAVSLHELGHVLGLEHVSNGVMSASRVTIEFSEEDLEMCHKVGAC